MAARDVDNLIQGPGWLYWAPLGTAEPADNALHNAPPSGDWTDLGFTEGGVTLTTNLEYAELVADQVTDVPARRMTRRELVVATNLAEATLDNYKRMLSNAGTSATGAAGADASGFDAYDPEVFPAVPIYFALIFDGLAPDGLVRRVILRRVLQVGNIEAAYGKEDQTVFSAEFSAHYVSPTVAPYKIVDQTAVPTG